MSVLLRAISNKDAEIRELTAQLRAYEAQAAQAQRAASQAKAERQAEMMARQRISEGEW